MVPTSKFVQNVRTSGHGDYIDVEVVALHSPVFLAAIASGRHNAST